MSYQLFLIGFGGACGAMVRFLAVSSTTALWGSGFPYGTLLVNTVGSFLAGIAFVLVLERGSFNAHHQALIIVGFFGAFTTFSTFSLETLTLLSDGALLQAIYNILANVSLSILAAYVGMFLAR